MNKVKQILKHYEDVALSDSQVLKLIDGRANLILYPDLHKYNTLDDILEPYGACILLFEAKPKYGHWCCIFKVNENEVEFFNPYGGYPDDSLDFIPLHFRLVSNQLHPYLSILMMNSPYELSYNEHKFQKLNKNIKTCGRWCAIRLVLRKLSLDDFTYVIKKLKQKMKITSDELVTLLTLHINN